jgi:hypothetical protein
MRRMAVALVVLVAALLAPANAVADELWPPYPCPGGALLADQAEAGPGRVVTVPGLIDCGVREPGPEFAVAVFDADDSGGLGFVHKELLMRYASPLGPTRFKLRGEIMGSEIFTSAAACLVTDPKTRLSCVHISPDLVVTRIATDDPRVDRPIRMLPPDQGTSPNCGTCWRVVP